jgi:Protein of unknown function (DUF3667)
MQCKNCNKVLNDNQKFCDDCGAKVIQNRLSPKILVRQIHEEFLSIDNKFLQTLFKLISKPESVIDGYINGVRKKFIGVIPFYAISLTVLGFQMFILKQFFPEFMDSQNNVFNESFKVGSAGKNNPFANFPDILNDYQGVFFSILMPFIAIGTWILFLDIRKHNYTEHLVINLYTTAQTIFFSSAIYLLLAFFGTTDYLIASFIITPITVIYGAFVFKRLYKLPFFNIFIRYMAAYIIYFIIFLVVVAIITVIALVFLYSTGKLKP